ncbi:MAG: hypothetical protein IPK64_16975 [bacterium]|nr:hypothetical protein [bacterium]
MNKTRVGLVLVLVVSLVIGVLAGLVSRSIFLKHVSAAEVSVAEKASATVTYIASGALLGLVIAVWSILVAWFAPRFGGKGANKPGSGKPA